MQYVGRALGSVSKTWSSINPATLSGAIDVIVVEHHDGTLHCSPFHVRFGKFQILKPSQKIVQVIVNGQLSNIPMKLSESGEAYFVFETNLENEDIPDDMLASPVVSAKSSPRLEDQDKGLLEPEHLDITDNEGVKKFQEKLTQVHIPSKVDKNGDLLLDIEGYKPSQNMMHDTDMQLRQLLRDELSHHSGEEDIDISKFIREDVNGTIKIINPYENSMTANNTMLSPSGSPPLSVSEPVLASTPENTIDSLPTSSLDSTCELTPTTSTETPKNSDSQKKTFIKTIRLTSDQLRCLNLNYGENDLSFSIENGKSTITAKLFVWRYDAPIIISDIDGTITKSDALGHLLTMVGKDWTHIGVADLFNEIAGNGYNILYLTARSAGQADSTRSYLRSVSQNGNQLPVGPVILSPDRTMAALRREMILKKPEIFKIACLNDIRSLYFNDNDYLDMSNDEKPTPFFAGFGNRITDALSYRTVGVPSSRIFTINPDGDVHMELLELAGYKSSYLHINELVDHFFPPVIFPDEEIRSIHSTTPGSPINNYIDHFDGDYTNNMNTTTENFDTTKSLFRINQEEKFTDVNFWREPLLNFDNLSEVTSDSDSVDKAETSPKRNPKAILDLHNQNQGTSPYDTDTITSSMTKSEDDIGKQIYLELGSQLSSPKMTHLDTTNIDNKMKKLSISRPTLPVSQVSKVNVLDDVHSNGETHSVMKQESTRNSEDEFDDDEFDEDEFID
ncbi:hypothetical protein KAFR_0B04860 [Kazachstania africana CBS 2517]|uniref:LNS2/PITP domain-containing protein n=1 Tax=Kazachstania africana (strain ATCC 22294 / BCRC 22015 / CBS 2517 / CECT 1963 / NBRC 1671 / NRRL Y-8276) TaxID=1071382 RepID=H2AQY2_KAZAF|nr:hypothetical protein KAFR_0B04860 [Kazachstania africana CBS 2517]CCF56782.1 hypothetical protein KAFR_0B04860 [Kazachstania africana CBS 2517]